MNIKNLLVLSAFLVPFEFSCFRPVLAATVCESKDGWQITCFKDGSSPADKIEIFNKSKVGIWLDIDKETGAPPTNYFHKHILLEPGKSEIVEYEDTTRSQARVLKVLNCATEQDVNDSIRCSNHLDVKAL